MVKNKHGHQIGWYQKYMKRLIDIVLSFWAIVILSPVLLITAFMVKINIGSPVIFKQRRPGENEKIFMMYKFRSMTDKRGADGKLLSDEARLTGFGKKLRASSLDELPELFNILKGDMSIVGPRPQLVRDMVFMSDEQRKRHTVKQGLTGLAQVSGRNDLTWEKKLKLDIRYIENISFCRDFMILMKTIEKVIKKEGICSKEMATAEDYGDYLLRMGRITADEYEEKMELARRLIERKGK